MIAKMTDWPEFLHRESDAAFASRAGSYLTGSLLADFRHCPRLYYERRFGRPLRGMESDERDGRRLVTAVARRLILHGLESLRAGWLGEAELGDDGLLGGDEPMSGPGVERDGRPAARAADASYGELENGSASAAERDSGRESASEETVRLDAGSKATSAQAKATSAGSKAAASSNGAAGAGGAAPAAVPSHSGGGQSAGSGKSGDAAHPGEGWSLHEFPPGLLDAASRLNDAVRQHPVAGRIVEAGVADRVVRASLGGLPSQARLDWFVPFQGLVRLEMVNDLDHFDWQAWRGELVHRLAFDRAVLAEIIGLNMPVQVVAVELRTPWRCGVWQLTERALRRAGRENDQAIQRLRKCLESDSWATGYEQPRVLDYSNS